MIHSMLRLRGTVPRTCAAAACHRGPVLQGSLDRPWDRLAWGRPDVRRMRNGGPTHGCKKEHSGNAPCARFRGAKLRDALRDPP